MTDLKLQMRWPESEPVARCFSPRSESADAG